MPNSRSTDVVTQSARPGRDGVHYQIWAPRHRELRVAVQDVNGSWIREIALSRDADGVFTGTDTQGRVGDLYKFAAGPEAWPDPGTHFQPKGVLGSSEVIDHSAFHWPKTEFKRPALSDLVIYECHIGTFTREGTFIAAIEKLPYLKDLGITALQIMPVGDFAGRWNWGYDGVDIYAPARCYGRPDDFKRLIAAAHEVGLAVILDVVYNHFGPDGNFWNSYSDDFFVKGDANIWGSTINFAAPQVREFFRGNVVHWMKHYHIDGFRLDATHAIIDKSKPHILTEISDEVRKRGGFTIAEDERNMAALITSAPEGIGIDAAWADDFHHVVKVAMTGERFAHFRSYEGTPQELLDTNQNGWLFTGQEYPQWKRPRGTPSAHLAPEKFIYCISNHDQVGNRPLGERLSDLVSREAYAAASALLCLLPYTPMIWQGQEWAASTHFCFFTDHAGEIGKNVSKGRLNEFKHYGADFGEEVLARMPDPQDPDTFQNSKLNWGELHQDNHRAVLEVYKRFLQFRRDVLKDRSREKWRASLHGPVLEVAYDTNPTRRILCDLHGGNEVQVEAAAWEIETSSGSNATLDSARLKFSKPETVILRRK
jgi:maltooligosyltrehalose trehalohydrolase